MLTRECGRSEGQLTMERRASCIFTVGAQASILAASAQIACMFGCCIENMLCFWETSLLGGTYGALYQLLFVPISLFDTHIL